jgi:tripartite-type tricarboxylate transporter receptor subunit TctC
MNLPRRRFLHLAAGAGTLPTVSRFAWAQTYPSRPVRLLVGFAAGGTTDIAARLIAQWLTERLGQPVVVENRPGASANLAAEAVVRSPPDGYTLLAVGSHNMINATLYQKLNYNFIDIAPVASIYRVPQIMEVNPSFPAKTVPEFIANAKAHPGQISFASAGNGSVAHVTGELFKMMTDVNMLHVPYRGAPPALTDHWRTSACHVRQHALFHRTYQGRQAAPFGGDRHDALAGASRRPHTGRLRAGFRDERVGGYRRAEKHAGRNHRHAQQGDQRRPRRRQGL